MEVELTLYGIVKESIVDGPGLRYVVFVQGCPHKCEGCHNPDSHNFNSGYKMSLSTIFNEIKSNPLLAGVTFSGGEPFYQAENLSLLADAVKSLGKTIITYTGYTLEELLHNESHMKLLKKTDTLVDGKFQKELKDYTLKFRGSSNQRIIDVKEELTS